MKITLASFALAALLFAGCTSGCLKDGSSAVGSVGATVGHNPESGMWTAGITITFKLYPSPEALAALRAAGATSVSEMVFVIPKYDRTKADQNKAIEAALREGAVLKGWKASP